MGEAFRIENNPYSQALKSQNTLTMVVAHRNKDGAAHRHTSSPERAEYVNDRCSPS
jgi:hypothetical protein